MKKVERKMIPVRFKWTSLSPDPIQYKPNNPTFEPQGVMVQILVPEEYILNIEAQPESIVLSIDGMAYVLEQFRQSIYANYLTQD